MEGGRGRRGEFCREEGEEFEEVGALAEGNVEGGALGMALGGAQAAKRLAWTALSTETKVVVLGAVAVDRDGFVVEEGGDPLWGSPLRGRLGFAWDRRR